MINFKKNIIKIKLIKSLIGIKYKHKNILKKIGLKKINSLLIIKNNFEIKKNIKNIIYLLKIS